MWNISRKGNDNVKYIYMFCGVGLQKMSQNCRKMIIRL
nr:MAG TPA: hypothetical protein [Caudoviricetes sp.]